MFSKSKGIKSWDEHAALYAMLSEARARIAEGSAISGSHYALMHYLKDKYGVTANGREASMSAADKLLIDFERSHSKDGLSDDERRFLEMDD